MAEQVFTSDNKLMSEYNREEEFNRRYDSGITIARQEGEQVGEIKGEQKKQQEIAINMLKDKLPFEIIAKYTKLSLAELSSLKQSLSL